MKILSYELLIGVGVGVLVATIPIIIIINIVLSGGLK